MQSSWERERERTEKKKCPKNRALQKLFIGALSQHQNSTSGKNFKNINGVNHDQNNEKNTLKMHHFIF